MARKKIRPKNRKQPTPEWLINYLTSGKKPTMYEEGAVECWQLCGGGDQLQEAWQKACSGILKHCKQNTPGRRPWPWWLFDAPGPRLKISGNGLPSHEKYPSVLLSYFMGVPRYIDDFEKNDQYESEPAFLKRHGLLSKSEELLLSEADFMSVSILEIREKQAE